jgi:hypothetical protein
MSVSEKNKFITEPVLLLGKYAPSGTTVVVDTDLPAAKCRFLHNRISAQTLRKETDLVLAETKEEQLEHCAKLIRLLMPYQLTVDKLSEDVFDYFDLARALEANQLRAVLELLFFRLSQNQISFLPEGLGRNAVMKEPALCRRQIGVDDHSRARRRVLTQKQNRFSDEFVLFAHAHSPFVRQARLVCSRVIWG